MIILGNVGWDNKVGIEMEGPDGVTLANGLRCFDQVRQLALNRIVDRIPHHFLHSALE